jgi:hypothetical protein
MVDEALKTPWKISLTVVAVAALGIAGWRVMAPREPRYEGKVLSEWMRDIGTGEVGILNSQWSPHPPYSRENYGLLIGNWPENLRSMEQSEDAIKRMGINVIPFILPMLRDHDTERRKHAVAALYCLGENVVPVLIEIFQDETNPPDVRHFAAYTFGKYARQSAGALPALKRAKRSSDPMLADLATEAVEAIEKGK